jgi:hypothetical protein
MSNPSPAIYERAAEVIEQRGWHRGNYIPSSTANEPAVLASCPVCVLGAINVATGYRPDADVDAVVGGENYEAALAFAVHLGFEFALADGVPVTGIVGEQWNDEDAEDAEQVITELRDFAASLKAGAR